MTRWAVDLALLRVGVSTGFNKFPDVTCHPNKYLDAVSMLTDGERRRLLRVDSLKSRTELASSMLYSHTGGGEYNNLKKSIVTSHLWFVTTHNKMNIFNMFSINGVDVVDGVYGGKCFQNSTHYHYIVKTSIVIPVSVYRDIPEIEPLVSLRLATIYIGNQLVGDPEYDDDLTDDLIRAERITNNPVFTDRLIDHPTSAFKPAGMKYYDKYVWFVY